MYTQQELESRLAELIAAHGVPGAQLAVLDGDEIVESAAGVLSLRTGCPTTPDALFLPGSIGKLYTATLVLMLAGEGRLDLDEPIRAYLPEFRVQDARAAEVVTPRHLLCHTSGFDGDHFTDTGRGDDALALYVDGCAELPQIAPPGLIWSYSNSGYSILGRIVEVLSGATFEDVLRERLFEPLGLEHTVSFAEQAIPHPTSVGHVAGEDGLVVSETWSLARAFGPMGAAVIASAGDVLRFVQPHLAEPGVTLLEPKLVAAMQEEQVRLVDDLLGHAWGLGWILDRWGEVDVIGHDGNSIGQNAFMRVAPGERFGFCLQTNVESALQLYREVASWLFGERFGVGPNPEPDLVTEESVAEPERYAGVYEREGLRLEVRADESRRLLATVTPTHAVAQSQGWPEMVDLPLRPADRPDTFMLRVPIADADLPAVFFAPEEPGGKPTYVHYGGRAKRRVSDG
ncbi:MAG: serine hydrolase domain-containing protein [Gaiellaceae bacterium]